MSIPLDTPVPDDRNIIDLTMMERALQLAGKAYEQDEVPIGAVVYRGDTIIAEGYNTREASNDPTAHAEIIAMRRAGEILGRWRLHDCSLAVTLEPCAMCAGAMVNARLARLVYGAPDLKAGACESLYEIPTDSRLNHRLQVIKGVHVDRCAALLSSFFQKKRRNQTDS